MTPPNQQVRQTQVSRPAHHEKGRLELAGAAQEKRAHRLLATGSDLGGGSDAMEGEMVAQPLRLA